MNTMLIPQGTEAKIVVPDLERTKDFFLHPKKLKKAFFKVDLDDKLKMIANMVWNVSIANKKIANISFKQPYDVLSKIPNKDDFESMRGRLPEL